MKPAFEEFCLPTKKYADVIVPRGAENTVAIDLIKQHIQVRPIQRATILTNNIPQDIIWRSNGARSPALSRSNSESKIR